MNNLGFDGFKHEERVNVNPDVVVLPYSILEEFTLGHVSPAPSSTFQVGHGRSLVVDKQVADCIVWTSDDAVCPASGASKLCAGVSS